jgi:signal transduction histidine kinase
LPSRSTSDPPPAATSAADDDALVPAVEAVIGQFRALRGDALDHAEVIQITQGLAKCLAAAGDAPPEVEPRLRTVLGRRVLELLRAAVVDHWATKGPPGAQQMLATLHAFERVRSAVDPDWSEFFASRLSGPGALDLIVEVAHDLRSPLTSVLFLAETLQRGQSGAVNDVQHRQLGLIYSAALGLSAVTSDIIELARGGERLLDPHPSPFSITEILESVRDIVHPIAEEKGLGIRIVPPESDKRMGYPLALSRVLLNLTTNALKFTDTGYVEIACQTGSPNQVEFSVRDTGRGIVPEALETLYSPFRRTPARAGGYCFSGTGLGLAICRRLVEAMGATLGVDTKADAGTRFHFTLSLPSAREL